MPINGLTNRGLSFAEIGQIRKGGAKTEKGIGRDLNYFRVVFDERDKEAIEIFVATYGDQPQKINIVLPFPEIDRVWDAWLEAYTAGRMIARSDGEKYIYRVDPRTGEVLVNNGEPYMKYDPTIPVDSYTSKDGKKKEIFCKPVGRLRVVIPELKRLAFLTLMTGSKHDIGNISSQLDAIAAISSNLPGRIAGVPLVMKRVPRMISCPADDGQRVRREKWLISIEADPEWVSQQVASMKLLSFPTSHPALDSGLKNIDAIPDNDSEIDIPDFNIDDAEEQPYTEGEYTEAPLTEKPSESTRPYDAKTLKEKIGNLVKYFIGKQCKDTDRFAMVKNLELCFAGSGGDPIEKRRQVCEYLLGKAHASELNNEQVLALKYWLSISQDPQTREYFPSKEAITEAGFAWTAWAEHNGQQIKLNLEVSNDLAEPGRVSIN